MCECTIFIIHFLLLSSSSSLQNLTAKVLIRQLKQCVRLRVHLLPSPCAFLSFNASLQNMNESSQYCLPSQSLYYLLLSVHSMVVSVDFLPFPSLFTIHELWKCWWCLWTVSSPLLSLSLLYLSLWKWWWCLWTVHFFHSLVRISHFTPHQLLCVWLHINLVKNPKKTHFLIGSLYSVHEPYFYVLTTRDWLQNSCLRSI